MEIGAHYTHASNSRPLGGGEIDALPHPYRVCGNASISGTRRPHVCVHCGAPLPPGSTALYCHKHGGPPVPPGSVADDTTGVAG